MGGMEGTDEVVGVSVLLLKGELGGVVLLDLLDREREANEHVARELSMLQINSPQLPFLPRCADRGEAAYLPRNLDFACTLQDGAADGGRGRARHVGRRMRESRRGWELRKVDDWRP